MKRLALVAAVLTGALIITGSLDLHEAGAPDAPPSVRVSPRYIEIGPHETAVPNMVTAVLADYRSFDTLGEVAVIFTAAVSVALLLARDPADRRRRD